MRVCVCVCVCARVRDKAAFISRETAVRGIDIDGSASHGNTTQSFLPSTKAYCPQVHLAACEQILEGGLLLLFNSALHFWNPFYSLLGKLKYT